jgi:hypothetical protein
MHPWGTWMPGMLVTTDPTNPLGIEVNLRFTDGRTDTDTPYS